MFCAASSAGSSDPSPSIPIEPYKLTNSRSKGEPECRAATRRASDEGERPPVHFGELPRNVEAETGAGRFFALFPRRPNEAFEDPLSHLSRYARPIVLDIDHRWGTGANPNHHPGAIARVAEGVVDQIVENPRDVAWVSNALNRKSWRNGGDCTPEKSRARA